jgi:hypothetical protein
VDHVAHVKFLDFLFPSLQYTATLPWLRYDIREGGRVDEGVGGGRVDQRGVEKREQVRVWVFSVNHCTI